MKNLKGWFRGRIRVVFIVACLLAVITIGYILIFPGAASPMNNLVSMVVNPAKSGVTLLVEKAEQLYDYLFRYEQLEQENEALREQMAEMNQDIRDSQTYKEENERLRNLLNIAEKNTDYELEIANVVSWGGSGFGSVMTISKGSSAGISAGMCAITESGQLVGLVTEAGTNWATVTTILDTSSEIGAYVFGSGYTCIAQGDTDLMNEGKLMASYLSTTATVHNQDQLLTSGDADVYPPGLIIGNISDVGNDETNVSKYAIVTPTVEIATVEQVFIIKSYAIND